MKDIKIVSGFAVFGFVVSFVSSLFSPHSSFIHKLLMAIIFLVVFGLIGFVIKMIYDKFLKDQDGEFSTDISSENPMVTSQTGTQKGQLVDIVIQDEEISPGESENRFVVGDKRQMLNASDVKGAGAETKTSAASAENNAPKQNQSIFVPNALSTPVPEVQNNVEPVVKAEPAEPVVEKNSGFVPMSAAALTKSVTDNSAVVLDEQNEIDTLPDMNNFSFGESDSSSEENDGDYNDDSDFDSSYSSGGSVEVPEVKDAGLIAKAISSVLADEKSI